MCHGLEEAVSHLNSAVHKTTGFPPEHLFWGGNLAGIQLRQRRMVAKERIRKQLAYDNKLLGQKIRHSPLTLYEKVWLRDGERLASMSRKFDPYWTGPFVLIRRESHRTWTLQHGEERRIVVNVHSDNLKRYFE